MSNFSLVPPENGPYNITVNGRAYATTGDPISVPKFDAILMMANGWAKVATEGAGLAGGIATLDSTGVVTASQAPAASVGALVYKGTWNASTNSPTLTSSVGTKGFYYRVSTAGSTNIDGITSWRVGDTIIYNGTDWDKLDGSDLANVALSGAYSDLSGAPVLADVALSGDYDDLNDAPVLSSVAISGDYADLSNKPTTATYGKVTLEDGVKAVANTSVTSNSLVFLQVQSSGGTPGLLSIALDPGVGFTINSANVLDTSVVAWSLVI